MAFATRRVVPPLEGEQLNQASRAYQQLASVLASRRKGAIQLVAEGSGAVAVPREAFELFVAALERLAAGQAVTLIPMTKEITTQEAAEFLNVSRPFLIRLLEGGRIPFRKVGTHRRIRFGDVLRFRQEDDRKRAAVASKLTADAEKLGLEY
jgi:excisionase family DNA binding protein